MNRATLFNNACIKIFVTKICALLQMIKLTVLLALLVGFVPLVLPAQTNTNSKNCIPCEQLKSLWLEVVIAFLIGVHYSIIPVQKILIFILLSGSIPSAEMG